MVWGATFVAVLVSSLAASVLVFCAIGLSEGAIPSRRLAKMLGADLVVALTNSSVALSGATIVAHDLRAAWLLVPPAAVLLLAYRAYVSERAKHQSLEFLYGVTRSLSRGRDLEPELLDLLQPHARELPRADGRDRAAARPGRTSAPCARRSARTGARRRWSRISPVAAAALRATVESEHAVRVQPRSLRARACALPGRARHRRGADRAGARRDAARGRDGARRPVRRDDVVHRRGPAAVRGARHARGPVARARPARARGAERPAHRARQPHAVPAPRARSRWRAAGAAWRPCCSSTSTTSRRSTTAPAMGRATQCWSPPPAGSSSACGRATSPRAWAATSSRCCWRTSTTITASRSPAASSICWPSR